MLSEVHTKNMACFFLCDVDIKLWKERWIEAFFCIGNKRKNDWWREWEYRLLVILLLRTTFLFFVFAMWFGSFLWFWENGNLYEKWASITCACSNLLQMDKDRISTEWTHEKVSTHLTGFTYTMLHHLNWNRQDDNIYAATSGSYFAVIESASNHFYTCVICHWNDRTNEKQNSWISAQKR